MPLGLRWVSRNDDQMAYGFPEITDQHVFGVKWNLVATRTHSAHTVQYDLWVWPTHTHTVWGLFCSLFITQKTKIPPEKIITLAYETAGSCWHVKFNLWCYNVPYWNNRGRNVTSTFLPVSIFFSQGFQGITKIWTKKTFGMIWLTFIGIYFRMVTAMILKSTVSVCLRWNHYLLTRLWAMLLTPQILQ